MSFRKNLIAYIALFVALGGTSYAAVALPYNSVGSRQLRDGAITNVKVKAHSLRATALAVGVIPTAAPKATLKTTIVTGAYGPPSCGSEGCPTPPVGTTMSYNANCPVGTVVVSGGFMEAYPNSEAVATSRPLRAGQGDPIAGSPGGWGVTFRVTALNAGLIEGGGTVYAVCGSV
jgi:hypothetical protein